MQSRLDAERDMLTPSNFSRQPLGHGYVGLDLFRRSIAPLFVHHERPVAWLFCSDTGALLQRHVRWGGGFETVCSYHILGCFTSLGYPLCCDSIPVFMGGAGDLLSKLANAHAGMAS